MIISITDFINDLTEYFEEAFKDYHGLAYKCSCDPNSGENTAHPDIYQYLMPSSMLENGYPVKSPCIVLCIDELTQDGYSCSVHACVSYSAIAEQEKVHKVPGEENVYEYSEADGYDTVSDVQLYKSSLLFTTHLHQLLCNYTRVPLENITVELPNPALPDFPHSVSAISFTVKPNRFNIGTCAYHDLY